MLTLQGQLEQAQVQELGLVRAGLMMTQTRTAWEAAAPLAKQLPKLMERAARSARALTCSIPTYAPRSRA